MGVNVASNSNSHFVNCQILNVIRTDWKIVHVKCHLLNVSTLTTVAL